MKRIIVTASALFLMVAITYAQTDSTAAKQHHPHPHWGANGGDNQGWHGRQDGGGQHEGFAGREGHHGHWGKPHIQLTADQKQQAKAIRESYEKQMAALYANDNLKLGDFKKKSAELRKDQKAKFVALLTPEQKGKIEAFKKKREENMQVMAAARLERMKIELELKDDQVASIKTAQASLHQQMKALHEDMTLLPEQKREKMKELMEKQKETVKAILTPDQQSKMESFRKHKEWRG